MVGSDTETEVTIEDVEDVEDSTEVDRFADVVGSTETVAVGINGVTDVLGVAEEMRADVLGRGAGTSTVTGGEMTLIMEYPIVVTVAGDGLIVTMDVSVDSGPSIVLVIGDATWVTVWIMVNGAAGSDPSSPVAAAGPPSTGTTEYLALLTKTSGCTSIRGAKGNALLRKRRVDRAKNEV